MIMTPRDFDLLINKAIIPQVQIAAELGITIKRLRTILSACGISLQPFARALNGTLHLQRTGAVALLRKDFSTRFSLIAVGIPLNSLSVKKAALLAWDEYVSPFPDFNKEFEVRNPRYAQQIMESNPMNYSFTPFLLQALLDCGRPLKEGESVDPSQIKPVAITPTQRRAANKHANAKTETTLTSRKKTKFSNKEGSHSSVFPLDSETVDELNHTDELFQPNRKEKQISEETQLVIKTNDYLLLFPPTSTKAGFYYVSPTQLQNKDRTPVADNVY